MVIEPGDINLMTAGRGIVHSERSPEEERGGPLPISGLQTWLALPDAVEEIGAGLCAYATTAMLPAIVQEGIQARVVIGRYEGSVVAGPGVLGHALCRCPARPGRNRPCARRLGRARGLCARGTIDIAGDRFAADRLLVFRPGDEITVRAERGRCPCHDCSAAHALGSPRHIWWNFVSSSKERIEQAKEEWRSRRFDIVPGDEEEFIPLPER